MAPIRADLLPATEMTRQVDEPDALLRLATPAKPDPAHGATDHWALIAQLVASWLRTRTAVARCANGKGNLESEVGVPPLVGH